jgi:large subunit ribosomal protein L25
METIQIEAKKRNDLGKNKSKQMRKHGNIPGVVYGEQKEPIHITVDAREAGRFFRNPNNKNALISLNIQDESSTNGVTVLSKKVDRDAISQEIIHLDFIQVDPKHPIKTEVALKFTGSAPGVKKGGNIFYNIRKVNIQCLPHSIPAVIEVDLSPLEVGTSLRIRDVSTGDFKILTSPDEIIVYVESTKSSAAAEAQAS